MERICVYNCFGVDITGKLRVLQNPAFQKGKLVDKAGVPIPAWTEPNEVVDGQGFDKTNIEENGSYKITVELPKGTKLCRYGAPGGRLTAPLGTPYELVGLPWVKETVEYHEYTVVADGVDVKCIVTKGIVREMFDSPGGAIQYLHPVSIEQEIISGRLAEDLSWLDRRTIK